MVNKRKDHVYFYNDPDTDYEVDESMFSVPVLTQIQILKLVLLTSIYC